MADKRWKAVERAVATEFNRVLSGVGNFSPIERIPLLGREGPDLTINETGLVINVKSRAIIPANLIPTKGFKLHVGKLVIVRLNELGNIPNLVNMYITLSRSRTGTWKKLDDWYDFMDKWTKEYQPDGISAIVLHRPRMPIGNCGVAIELSNLRRLSCQLTNQPIPSL